MDSEDNILCCGCLCSGRKMIIIERFWEKQCFLQIINEMPTEVPENLPLWLCWECTAYNNRFTKFKQQVKNSYAKFQEYTKKNINSMEISHTSALHILKLYNLDITSNVAEEDEIKNDLLYQIVKTEKCSQHTTHIDINIKDETDNVSVHSGNITDRDDNLDTEKFECKNKIKKVKKNKRKKDKQLSEYYKEIDLNQEEIHEERSILKLREEFTNAIFKCVRCIIPFPNNDDLRDHVAVKHDLNASKFLCAICECSFSNEVSFNYHKNRHARRYQCVVCKEIYTSKCKATRHYEVYHYTEEMFNAQQPSTDKHNYTVPAQNDDASQMFPCPLCEKSFKWKTSLRKHSETHRIRAGQTRQPYCETCRLSFTTTSNLQKHLKTSSKHQIQLKLNAIKASVGEPASTDEIKSIKATVTSTRCVLACPQCGRRFQWRGNLQRHMRSHRARSAGELVCVPCNRTFSSIATFKQHLKISKKHVSENDFQYQCQQCEKKFANKTRLKEHVDWEHLKNYVHTCGLCQKVFKSQTSLYLHKKVVHNKDSAEHLCDHCGKPFPNGAKLRSHIAALHSATSPYRCGECGARFNWHSCLSRHVRVLHGKGKRASHVTRADV